MWEPDPSVFGAIHPELTKRLATCNRLACLILIRHPQLAFPSLRTIVTLTTNSRLLHNSVVCNALCMR